MQWPNWVPSDNGNATGKSDYGRIASYSYVEDDHVFLVLGFDRGSNSQGNATANYYFELNQAEPQAGNDPNPVRTVGDVRINLNDDGSNLFTTSVEVWDGNSWEPAPADGRLRGGVERGHHHGLGAVVGEPERPLGSITPEGFIELSLDLTSFGVVLGCPSSGFNALNGRSTTGESEKNLVDYFAAQPINIPSTCASLFIRKFEADGRLRWAARPSRSRLTRCPTARLGTLQAPLTTPVCGSSTTATTTPRWKLGRESMTRRRHQPRTLVSSR